MSVELKPPGRIDTATAYAPAGVGNVAVGFDVLGHALDAIGDKVTVWRTAEPRVEIVEITGCDEVLPLDPAQNTATAGLVAMLRELALPFGFAVRIEKAIPLGSGMGGSAASAVGGMVAANALLEEPLPLSELLRFALVGETVASGSAHADNLAPGLYGGLTLVRAMDPPDILSIPVPEEIRCVLVHPHLRLDTRVARGVLPREIPMGLYVHQSANLAGFVSGCHTGDLELIRRSFVDLVAEPHRAPLIRGFAAVKAAALEAGALGCSISGGGPSVFAWCAAEAAAADVRDGMVSAFARAGVDADAFVSPVNAPGARLVEAS
ncbi:MAG: homoserine kinase [Gemmatimonadetes bacterium]|nr:homoserine kinase [Gemmatimonadota bacterium]